MICSNCNIENTIHLVAKCDDRCIVRIPEIEHRGYVPSGLSIGGSDYIRMNICMSCGQIQNFIPINKIDVEEILNECIQG